MHPGHESLDVLLMLVGKCTGLKILGAVMWDGFRHGGGDDLAVRSVLLGVENNLEKFRRRLKNRLDTKLEGGDGGLEERREICENLKQKMPKVEILGI